LVQAEVACMHEQCSQWLAISVQCTHELFRIIE
jgi:hypothetical protein